tara:strand:- start:7365 stop:7691 length:327 start_codon:yes stop_codon:yes gene_type:complete
MSIFDNLLGKTIKEEEKISSEEESLELIKSYLGDDLEIVDLQSHNHYKKFQNRKKMYRFTIRLLSLDLLARLGNDKRVKNVYFASRHPHPGGGADSISLRHKVIVEYH